MATELKLPEDLAGVDGVTVSRWLVKVGSAITAGQPILEVATEKVDTQIEAPVDGTLLKIVFGEGELVPPGAALALIGETSEQFAQPAKAQVAQPAASQAVTVKADEQPESSAAPKATPVARKVAEEAGVSLGDVTGTGAAGQVTKDDVLAYAAKLGEKLPRVKGTTPSTEEPAPAKSPESVERPSASPGDVVGLSIRRMAVENRLDLRALAAGRPLGALTHAEVMAAVARQQGLEPVSTAHVPQWQAAAPTGAGAPSAAHTVPGGKVAALAGDLLVPHTRMRALIARNTTQAAFSIPHVTTMWDVDMSAVLAHRRAHKAEYATAGVNLTVTPYLLMAILAGLRKVPSANSSWTDEGVILRHEFNLGMAVALPPDEHGMGGLIVPVIKHVDDLSLQGLVRAVNDLSTRARANQLKNEDMQGGTFTLTNYGTSGSRFQTPVISGNQAGILGVGAIEKRAVVVSKGHPLDPNPGDALVFLPMTTLGFSYDHRILDGATADAFCAAVKSALEEWPA
jgi:2-oxoisovalerate dehydrogenase E2 component (dihydrolipoyl transacylase)